MILRLTKVIAGYGGGDVLQGVDIEVAKGSIACIVGPNGAGKSTVLRAISGLLEPRLGSISFGDAPIDGLSPRQVLERGIVHVPQERSLFPSMTVWENVLMGAYIIRRDRALVKRRYDEAEALFPVVAERAGEKAGNLSGGQRRMVEFARSLMLDPKLILLDEPAGGINPTLIERMGEMIRELNARGTTFLIVEHNMPFVLGLCDPVLVLARGSCICEGTPEQIQRDPKVLDAYLGDDFVLDETLAVKA